MKRKIHVGIIDSGVKMTHNVFNKSTITNYLFKDGEFIPTMEDCDSYGHGTAVAGIIAQSANVDIVYSNLTVDTISRTHRLSRLVV